MTVLSGAVILLSCSNKTLSDTTTRVTDTVVQISKQVEEPDFDTVFTVENNQFHLRFWRDTSVEQTGDELVNNSFIWVANGSQAVIADSIFTSELYHGADVEDFNRDGNSDISVGKETGGNMANEFIYLYCYDNTSHSFKKVDGIDSLPTVYQDSTGLVISQAFYGNKVNQAFFYINNNFRLINLQEEIETVLFDDTSDLFEKTFKKALKKYKKVNDK